MPPSDDGAQVDHGLVESWYHDDAGVAESQVIDVEHRGAVVPHKRK